MNVFVKLIKLIFRFFLGVFYREVDVVGKENVPPTGPCIFVGNHQNQFVDACLLFGYCRRDVGFLMAAKSFNRFVVGQFARWIQAIPVLRAADMARKGIGTIERVEGTALIGAGTKFTEQVRPGDCVGWRPREGSGGGGGAPGEEVMVTVKEVLSDTELTLERPPAAGQWPTGGAPRPFRVMPRVDHSQMYDAVYDTLKKGRAVGVFPEGGSHDRTSLLPFKSGCAVFALGATQHGCRPTIIPFGLTYFHGHHFRSRAHLEFGEPLVISDEILALYNANPKAGVKALMHQIEEAVRDITMQFRNYDELKMIHTMRHLYVPRSVMLVTGEYLRITRRLAQAYDLLRDREEIIALAKKIEHYQTLTESFWMIDAQVETIPDLKRFKSDPWLMYALFLRNVVTLVFFALLAAPGYLLNFPLVAIAKLVAVRQARLALAGSTVKVAGRDVMASYKIITLMSVGPVMYTSIFLFNWATGGLTYAVTVTAVLMVLTYVSLFAIFEAIMRFKSIIPFFLWMAFRRYRRMFWLLYDERRELEREVRKAVGALGPTLGERIWNERTQTLYEIILAEELRLQANDETDTERGTYGRPFQAKRRSRLRPPRARDKILFWLNKVLHLNINWDYLAFPELKEGKFDSSASLDSFDDFVSLGTGLGEPKAWGTVKVAGEQTIELDENVLPSKSPLFRPPPLAEALGESPHAEPPNTPGSPPPQDTPSPGAATGARHGGEPVLRQRIPAAVPASD